MTRRFCTAGQTPKCGAKGIQLIFNQEEAALGEGYTPFTGPSNSTVFMNVSAIAAGAVEADDTEDSSGHDLSHELGHQFQLHHLP
jgi:hypothetical protein